jgi:hypothetical protein
MQVLILCESSGTVRDAFRSLGHEAYSCDILPTDSHPEWHHEGDAFEAVGGNRWGIRHWDLIIGHPPCTALAVSGNRWYGEGQPKHAERLRSAQWTEALWDLCKLSADRVAFENPVGVLARLTSLPKASYVEPWQHGHPEQKKTGLHLYNLPALEPTDDVYDHMMTLPLKERQRIHYLPPSEDRWQIRSKTFEGIAAAMAAQWGSLA